VYSLHDLAEIVDILRREGIDGVIIGSTCRDVELGIDKFEDDVDIFVLSMSPFFEGEKIYEIAERNGWDIGSTELGTPSISIPINNENVRVELYENIHDFYIPPESLEVCTKRVVVDNTELNLASLECWIVFKARRWASDDMIDVSSVVQKYLNGELSLNLDTIRRILELYEEDAWFIKERLRSVGLKI